MKKFSRKSKKNKPAVSDEQLNEINSNAPGESHAAHETADPTADRREPANEQITTTDNVKDEEKSSSKSSSEKQIYKDYVNNKRIDDIADENHMTAQEVVQVIQKAESKR